MSKSFPIAYCYHRRAHTNRGTEVQDKGFLVLTTDTGQEIELACPSGTYERTVMALANYVAALPAEHAVSLQPIAFDTASNSVLMETDDEAARFTLCYGNEDAAALMGAYLANLSEALVVNRAPKPSTPQKKGRTRK